MTGMQAQGAQQEQEGDVPLGVQQGRCEGGGRMHACGRSGPEAEVTNAGAPACGVPGAMAALLPSLTASEASVPDWARMAMLLPFRSTAASSCRPGRAAGMHETRHAPGTPLTALHLSSPLEEVAHHHNPLILQHGGAPQL